MHMISFYDFLLLFNGPGPKLTAAVTRRVIIALWCHAFFWAVTPLIGWSKYDYEPFGTSCSIDWISRTVNNYSYMLLTTITNYVIPIIIMVICYTKIIRRSRKVDPLRVEERDRSMRVINKLDQLEIKIDNHVTKMCVVMTCSFIIAWTPYAVESLWMSQSTVFVGPISSTLPTMLAKSSCMMNPLIYLTSSSTFRRDVVKLLRRASRQRPILDDNIQAPTGDGNGPRSSGRFYLKNTKNAHGKSSCAIYFDKKQIFIGDVSPENIEKDSSLAQRDPDRISVRFSSFDASTSNREYQLNLPANQNLDKPKVDLPKNFEMNDNPGTSSDSKQQSRMTTSPIFN
ncbi:putative rhodopsin, G0-coupled-like [Apostichopus japonicus]|uniref:Putative rhodopsin, G0-coupled-like n=2 Tax=Stichopus japonicus TaxID=307972 RepID=A0A2G8L2G4_STIJA|nr:putative rhodopsin, G0-coupled-like [Apostichopus japonicus]